MNKKYFFFWFAIVAICATLFSACKKEPVDYRDKWVGEWEFTTYDYREHGTIAEPFIIERDTIHYVGRIEIHGADRLKIMFKPNATEPFPINGLIYPVVDNLGALSYPEYLPSLYFYLYGELNGSISENAININYDHSIGSNGPLGLKDNENHTIRGIRINKK